MDPVWGYEAINVEAQQSDPSSLLNWMRNMIALRKLFRVFGRGTLEFLNPANRKVLAYLRRYQDEQVLCVANLSRFAQPVDLDLADLEGATPLEMLGYVQFPRIERQPYRLSLGPYGFLWLELHGRSEPAAIAAAPDMAPLRAENWETVLEGRGRSAMEGLLLPEYLVKQRWFGGKARRIQGTRIVDWGQLRESAVLALVEVRYESGDPDNYLVALSMTYGPETGRVRERFPAAVLGPVVSQRGLGLLYDATMEEEACVALLSLIEGAGRVATRQGDIRGAPGGALAALRGAPDTQLPVALSPAEQSNTSLIYGDRLMLKLFRRQQAGINPESEIGKALTEKAHFNGVPPYAGSIEYEVRGGGCGHLPCCKAWSPTREMAGP